MFKGMPKAFWIGLVIMYGYTGLFLILEFTIPGFSLMKFFGIPGCWIYNTFIALFLLNVFVAWYFAYSEERREAKLGEKS